MRKSDGGIDDKPRVYWCYYPKLKRGFWRVYSMKTMRSAHTLERWRFAHDMVKRMNEVDDTNARRMG